MTTVKIVEDIERLMDMSKVKNLLLQIVCIIVEGYYNIEICTYYFIIENLAPKSSLRSSVLSNASVHFALFCFDEYCDL
jgi:hypothetical protein